VTRLTGPRRFVLLVLTATAVCIAVCLAVHLPALRAVAAAPLVLLLPGAALVTAIDPWSARLRKSERLYWSVGSSIGIAILGGLVLNEVTRLSRFSWCVFLAIVVVATSVVCWDRSGTPGEHYVATRKTHGLKPRSVVLLVCAAGLLAGSIVFSQLNSSQATRENFTELWMIPRPVIAGDYAKRLQVGVSNHENAHETFIVTLTTNGRTLRSWRLLLKNGQSWQKTLPRPHEETIYATVAIASDVNKVLSSVHLSAPAP
jgi:uncharacterized membrane protein